MKSRIARRYDEFLAQLAFFAGLVIAGIAAAVTFDVAMRYIFGRPTFWAQDLSEYGMLWATFMAAPWLLQQGAHVRVELLVERLPEMHRRWLGVLTDILGGVICLVLAWQAAAKTIEFYVRGDVIRHEWAVPQFYPYIILPIGSLLLAIEFFRSATGWNTRAPDRTAVESGL